MTSEGADFGSYSGYDYLLEETEGPSNVVYISDFIESSQRVTAESLKIIEADVHQKLSLIFLRFQCLVLFYNNNCLETPVYQISSSREMEMYSDYRLSKLDVSSVENIEFRDNSDTFLKVYRHFIFFSNQCLRLVYQFLAIDKQLRKDGSSKAMALHRRLREEIRIFGFRILVLLHQIRFAEYISELAPQDTYYRRNVSEEYERTVTKFTNLLNRL